MTNLSKRVFGVRGILMHALLATVLILPVPAAGCGNSQEEGAPETTEQQADVAPYDLEAFDSLLGRNVADGLVDYEAFSQSDAFDDVVSSLEDVDTAQLGDDEELAFWINAYNALVIRTVLDNPGTANPLDVDGFFDKKTHQVAGTSLTLNQIENEVVRPKFKEPLIHFGLVCAALSCPPLIPEAYTASNVRSRLAENARAYLADSDQNRFDRKSGSLQLSKIFEWYKVDFGDSDDGLREFAMGYGPADMKGALEDNPDAPVQFLEYDWTINAQQQP